MGRRHVSGERLRGWTSHSMRTLCFYNNEHVLSFPGQIRGVDATVDESCDNANRHYMEWLLAVETVKA